MNASDLIFPALALAGLMSAAEARGQSPESGTETESPRTIRVVLGPQFGPSYPGSDEVSLRPLAGVTRGRAGQPFAFEAPDESIGFALVRTGGFSLGPSLGFEGKRDSREIGAQLPDTGFSVELGGFIQQQIGESLRLRAEARQGVSGHEGFISVLSADYILRDGLRQEFSIGPRLTITDDRYQDAYFSVLQEDAVGAGLPVYDADGGLQAVGAAAGYIRQFTPRWGIYSYVKYDRLVADPASSPIVTRFGSRDQFSGGIALTYTFTP